MAQAFTKVWRTLEQGDTPKNLTASLNRAVEDKIADFWRKAARRTAVGYEAVPIGGLSELDELAQQRHLTYEIQTFRTDFDQALRDLDEPERDAFILTELRGLRQAESAELLDIDQTTVSRRASAARTFIREELIA